MFHIWYTNLKQFMREIPMDATVYHAILHTTAGRTQYAISRIAALHLRAIERETNTIHLLAIPGGRYETINERPFDEDAYKTVVARTDALRTHVLTIVEVGYPIVEAIPAIPDDIQYIYAERPEDFHFRAENTN